MVGGDKVASRIAHYRDIDLANQFQDIFTETVFIGKRVSRVINAAVNGPSQMLHKGTEDTRVNRACGKMLINADRRFHFIFLPDNLLQAVQG